MIAAGSGSIVAALPFELVVVPLLIGQRLWTAVGVSVMLALALLAALLLGLPGDRMVRLDRRIRAAGADKVGTIIVPALLVIVGLVVRGSYSAFYTPLNVLPEEVGFDAPTLLQLSGALLFLIGIGYLLLLGWFTAIAETYWYGWHRRLYSYPGTLSLVLVTVFALGLTVVGTLDLRWEASDEAGEALRGCVVRPIEPLGMTLVGIRAQLVDVYWNGPTPPNLQLNDGPFLYLGQANGTVVIYARHDGDVVRIPAGSVATRSIGTVDGC